MTFHIVCGVIVAREPKKYKNSTHSSTRYILFFANIGYYPHWTMIDHPKILKSHLRQLQEVHVALSKHLHVAQATQKKATIVIVLTLC